MHTDIRVLLLGETPEASQRLAQALTVAFGRPEVVHVEGERLAQCLDEGPWHALLVDLDKTQQELGGLAEILQHRDAKPPVFVYSQRVDDGRARAAASLGAAAVLAKPVNGTQLARLLGRHELHATFTGSCAGVPTALLVMLHASAGSEGVLHLETQTQAGRVGSIFFENGQLVHATCGTVAGPAAVSELLSWTDARAVWIPGEAVCGRTIVGRWETLFGRDQALAAAPENANVSNHVTSIELEHPEVVEKLSRLAQTPDVLGAFILRHAEVVVGRCVAELDQGGVSRALVRLAHVYYDVKPDRVEQDDGHEIQAVLGNLRLVVDRIGPDTLGYQVGVVVRQAAPICKSLRRLLRQIDRTFVRSLELAGDLDGELRVA